MKTAAALAILALLTPVRGDVQVEPPARDYVVCQQPTYFQQHVYAARSLQICKDAK